MGARRRRDTGRQTKDDQNEKNTIRNTKHNQEGQQNTIRKANKTQSGGRDQTQSGKAARIVNQRPA